ncbi:hypothetical protein N9L91_01235 [Pseudomonadales bacterium]|nr:hypothetical protein [Pseudomonadales bacterium]
MRLDQLISKSTEAISAAQHSDSARLDAELLILHALKQSRSFLYAYPESIVNDDQLVAVNRLVQRRCEGEPVAYLLNQKRILVSTVIGG